MFSESGPKKSDGLQYSPELARAYVEQRERFNETDIALFTILESVGVKDKRVLDLGCGDGSHALRIKEIGAAQVVGVDINKEMIDLATTKSMNTPGVSFVVADGRKLPLENVSVDVVVSNYVIQYFTNTKEVFGEIARVLKERGYFVGTINIMSVDEGYEYLYNQSVPIRLGQGKDSVIVRHLIKSRQEIYGAIKEFGLSIVTEQELVHPNSTVDDSFPDKEHVTKHAIILTLQKISL